MINGSRFHAGTRAMLDGVLQRIEDVWFDIRVPFLWLLAATAVMVATFLIALAPQGRARLAELPSALAGLMGERSAAPSDVAAFGHELALLREEARAFARERARLELRVAEIERGMGEVTGSLPRASGTTSSTVDPPPASAAPNSAEDGGGAIPLALGPFGIDLGSEANIAGLRERWARLASDGGLARLEPLIAVSDGEDGRPMVALVAGPVSDVGEAAALCARLLQAGIAPCRPTLYDGQRLAAR